MASPVILFDLGGVLIDWNPRYLYRKLSSNEAEIERFLREVCPSEWNVRLDGGLSFDEGMKERIALFPQDEAWIRAYWDRWLEMIKGPIGGTVELLEQLHQNKRALYALTNWSAETYPLVKASAAYSFLYLFREVFVSGELKMTKPDPAIFRHVLKSLKTNAHDVFFIDDNLTNIEIASNLGFQTHHFTDSVKLGHALRRSGFIS